MSTAQRTGMKRRKEVEQKLRQVRFRHLKVYLNEKLKRAACNCEFSGCYPQGTEATCAHAALLDVPYRICDSRFGGDKIAQVCPHFQAKLGVEQYKEEFRQLMTRSRAEIAQRYPDIAALMWVLGEDFVQDIQLEADDVWSETETPQDSGSAPGPDDEACTRAGLGEGADLTGRVPEGASQEPRPSGAGDTAS